MMSISWVCIGSNAIYIFVFFFFVPKKLVWFLKLPLNLWYTTIWFWFNCDFKSHINFKGIKRRHMSNMWHYSYMCRESVSKQWYFNILLRKKYSYSCIYIVVGIGYWNLILCQFIQQHVNNVAKLFFGFP
jgi:hypothetical protein